MSDGARVTIRELAAALNRKPEQVETEAAALACSSGRTGRVNRHFRLPTLRGWHPVRPGATSSTTGPGNSINATRKRGLRGRSMGLSPTPPPGYERRRAPEDQGVSRPRPGMPPLRPPSSTRSAHRDRRSTASIACTWNTTPRRSWRGRRCRIRGKDTRPGSFPRSRDSHQAASTQRNEPNGSRATYVSMCEIRPRPGGGRIAADGGPRPPNESVAAAPRTAHCDPASASRLLGWPPLTSTRTGDPAKPSSVNARRTPAAPSTGSGIGPIRGRRPSARHLGDSQRPPRPGRRSCK
jgi:hypothetical protein